MGIDFKRLESQGLITIRPNSDNSLFIANYTPKVQFDKLWTDDLKKCRGLIFDVNEKIVSRPFEKFFNIEEYGSEWTPPNEPFEVYEKYDGSLGITYWHDGKVKLATRGSFDSDQAIKGSEMLDKFDYPFNPKLTYLFEIIYPENRIVVDYRNKESLVLLAIIETKTGVEVPINSIGKLSVLADGGLEIAVRYDGINDLNKIQEFESDNSEGFVIRFRSGLRVKSKFKEYVRLHRVLTSISSRSIWDLMRNNQPLDEVIDCVPDEFFDWVKEWCWALRADYINWYSYTVGEVFDRYRLYPFESKKDFALWAKGRKAPHLLFGLRDGKNIHDMIWKMIEPEYEKPFRDEN